VGKIFPLKNVILNPEEGPNIRILSAGNFSKILYTAADGLMRPKRNLIGLAGDSLM
jgi:hypothetical protein